MRGWGWDTNEESAQQKHLDSVLERASQRQGVGFDPEEDAELCTRRAQPCPDLKWRRGKPERLASI